RPGTTPARDRTGGGRNHLPRNSLGKKRMPSATDIWLNDIHSQRNRTRVRELLTPRDLDELTAIIRRAARKRTPLSVSGCRHAMGGQQFARDSICLDTRQLARVVSFDSARGLIEAEAGIQWPQLIAAYLESQRGEERAWGIAQKQTGADTFTLGGSLSANAHGRGLAMRPLISDAESFRLLDAAGKHVRCSRTENPELFRLAIGGYGLFGVITHVTLQLTPRRKLRRTVEIISASQLLAAFEARIAAGFLYGDFQFSIDEKSPDFLQAGVFSCYEPIADDTPMNEPRELRERDWLDLLALAHTDRAQVFDRYADYYLGTDGQTYWSDTHQLSAYLPDYAARLREQIAGPESSLIITELYVPRGLLADFLAAAAEFLRDGRAPVIYGTVRLVERDDESFLPWAKETYACVILNLQVLHTEAALATAAEIFRALIDLATARGGSYFLTYHRFATREQLMTCYPEFDKFLELKGRYDPAGVFQSDWFRHYESFFT
ncbi:MAG: FAD-binding oxidoreductase, partial [Chthoniobacterales bacterium]